MRRIPFCVLTALLLLAPHSRAEDRFSEIPKKVQPFVDKGEISGAVMLVATKDRILHLSAVGASDLATGRPMQTGDTFWIASMSKPITALGIALLVDDGKLSFDDPVEKYLPEFRRQWVIQEGAPDRRVLVPAARPIRIRDLLTHTSGMGEYVVTDPHWTLAEMSKVVAREPLRFQPGSWWAYSTAGLDVAGRVIEVASGQPFADFMRERLFDPLGMSHTTFWLTPAQDQSRARSYRPNAGTHRLEEAVIAYMYGGAVTDPDRPALGGAGLFSTAEDVAKLYQMMLNRGVAGGRQLIKSETLAEMTRNQIGSLTARPGMPWGLGFCVVADPTKMVANHTLSPGSFGHGGAFGTDSWADPTRGLIYVFMIQRDALKPTPDDSAMRRAYQDAAEEALVADSPEGQK
jgi:CubicO group peptidase (beta-lactamase class C family)